MSIQFSNRYTSEVKMLSLFDYLGRPAGKELGKLVATYGIIKNTKFDTRQVSTPNFKGTVLLYTREFLDEYFNLYKQHLNNK